MSLPAWITNWGRSWGGYNHACTVVRAAARGDGLDQILHSGVQALLEAGAADRAGLWLLVDGQNEPRLGRVVEAQPGPIPGQWKHLDISAPFLRKALESPQPMRVELGEGTSAPHTGSLLGMRSVTWIPIRVRNRPLGLAMVAHARGGIKPDAELLMARADEIALAVGSHHDARRAAQAAEVLRDRSSLARAILCDVSAAPILLQIARAARLHALAEFVAVGKGSLPPVSGEAWDGPDDLRELLRREPLLRLWRTAFEEGRESEMMADAVHGRSASPPDSSRSALDHVIAIPITAGNRTIGVLMAGFAASESSSEDFARLEAYVLLAASALDRELGRKERASYKKAFRRMIQESRECLVSIDERGFVGDASKPAAALLSSLWGRPEETLLEDFFSPDAREMVALWRRQATSSESILAAGNDGPQSTMEAPLQDGPAVRLHLRSKISEIGARLGEGYGGGAATLLVQLENRDERKTLREAEGRLEAEMAALADSIESGILLLDTAGHIRMVSDRLAAILGGEARRFLELGTLEALMDSLASQFSRPEETLERWREHVQRGGEASWDEFELVRPSRKIVERFARPILMSDGTPVGWLEVYRDITGQRIVQSKLLQTEKMAALGQLVSGIAHELNNPLTSIQGYAQLLRSRRSPSDRNEDARRISQEAERAARIVKNLLLFSRETKPERRAVNMNEVIERTLALRAYELKVENIAVELMLDAGLPPTLGDAAQLQQVILNLIVNAEQAIIQGRGEESRPGRIHLRTRRMAGDRIGLEVCDDGPGIVPEIVARIFDPFFTTKPVGVGTGLGLSIVYGIVQEHGGEVSVESRQGHGATLKIELPALSVAGLDFNAETTAAEPREAQAIPVPISHRTATRRERILIVEDEPTVAELIADVMGEEGYRVETLLDSREALGRLEKKRYGLVICDLKMPYLDGPGLYRTLMRRGNPLRQRLLFVTGDTMGAHTLDFLKSSGLPYLAKPFLVEELKEAVRQAFITVPSGDVAAAGADRSNAFARGK